MIIERTESELIALRLRGFVVDRYGNRVKFAPQSHFYIEAALRFVSLFKIKPEKSYRLARQGYRFHIGNIVDVVAGLFLDREDRRGFYVHSSTRSAVEARRYSFSALVYLDCIFYSEDKEKMKRLLDFYRCVDYGRHVKLEASNANRIQHRQVLRARRSDH